MCYELVNISITIKGLTSSEHSVLNVMAHRANKDTHECYPSIQSLHENTSLDKKTIQAVLVSLISKNHIIKTGKMVGKTKSVPVYKLNLSDPKNGTAQNQSNPVFSQSDPVFGSAKRSRFWDMEKEDFKKKRKTVFLQSSGPKTINEILGILKNEK